MNCLNVIFPATTLKPNSSAASFMLNIETPRFVRCESNGFIVIFGDHFEASYTTTTKYSCSEAEQSIESNWWEDLNFGIFICCCQYSYCQSKICDYQKKQVYFLLSKKIIILFSKYLDETKI
jgi:hypothetical protein